MTPADFSVKRPITIIMIFLAVILIGSIAIFRLPVELLPNFSFGNISIFVDIRGGMPAIEVEKSVAKPIEDAMGGVSHLINIISISEEGRCRVVLKFEPGSDMDFAALEVRVAQPVHGLGTDIGIFRLTGVENIVASG